MTEEFRARHSRGAVDLPDGVVIDPMCGMHVTLGRDAITLEHDGETKGFCAASCRRAYAKEHGLAVPA
jgi:YHS domain-containing protein